MLLVSHIVIALISIIWASYAVFAPSRTKIAVSWSLVAATLITGTGLVINTGHHILQACISGLLYTAVVTTMIVIAQRRLAHQVDY